MPLALDPAPLSALVLAAYLYARGVQRLRRRGVRVPAWQQVAWYVGLALMAVALLSLLDRYSEDLLVAHMAQHLLIADLAAPLLLTGLRWPMHLFLLPKAMLVLFARRRRLRRALAVLRLPLVAIPLYVLTLYAWHLSFMFEAALRSPMVHSLQHQSFVVVSILVWWPALEPHRRRLHGQLWKIGHVLAARLGGMFLGMALVVLRSPVYDGYYGDRAEQYGLSGLEDQQLAGALMLSLDFFVVLFVLSFFFWRAAIDDRPDGDVGARSGP